MKYEERWEKIGKDPIGVGGQGTVYLVRNKHIFSKSLMNLQAAMELLNRDNNEHQILGHVKFIDTVCEITKNDNGYLGALKELHSLEGSRNYKSAEERIKKEIQAMKDVTHPNLLDVVEVDAEEKWFVSRYYSKGTLTKNSHEYTGDLQKALNAIRPLVEGVAKLHEAGYVHRDIKPDNIFVSDEDNLILGDFGLVSFCDAEHTRISDKFENVGSRDWMPGWATSMKIEDVRPTFDVYSLGKTIWSMISETPLMRLWYWDDPEFNLKLKFPDTRYINLANKFLSLCVVERETDCKIKNATQLLEQIDEIIEIMEIGADITDIAERKCNVCGLGKYVITVNQNSMQLNNFGMTAVGNRKFKIFTCNRCGHVQLFTGTGEVPEPWFKDN
jgi:serine/threonine protein kinase